MFGDKRLMQSIAVVGLTGVLTFTASFSQFQNKETAEMVQLAGNGRAGVIAELAEHDLVANVWADQLSVEQTDVTRVGASDGAVSVYDMTTEILPQAADEENQDKDDTDTSKIKKQKKKQEEVKKQKVKKQKVRKQKNKKQKVKKDKWAKKLMANVDDFLYIRKTDNEQSEIKGKLRKGDVAQILRAGKKWTKIKSGSVIGYVKNEYCVSGKKAHKLAAKTCATLATVKTSGLRVRTKATKKADVVKMVEKGAKLAVNEETKEKDGWVAVSVGDSDGYVSEEYVTVALGTGQAISTEEEQEQLDAQRRTETAQAAVPSVAASGSDLNVLAAIIFCEAGGESYEGQVAVGAVVLNRVRSASFPGSISAVVLQGGQFSPVASGAFSAALSNGSYQYCMSAAQAALAGSDPTGGKLYFHRNGGGTAGLVIGHHVFY